MKRSLGLLALALMVLAGCGKSSRDFYVEMEAVVEVAPLIAPLPATVGVYYSPEFRNYVGTDTVYGTDSRDRYHVVLGGPSAAMFDWAFPAMFERTLVVRSKPPLTGGEGELDGVIEPRITGYTLTSINYDITLYAPSGEEIVSLPANGTYSGQVWNERQVSLAIRYAMRDACAAFLVRLPEQPEIKQWLASLDAVGRPEGPESDLRRQAEGAFP